MKIRENKKLFVFYYMLGFFAGILYANFQSKDYIASMGIFNEYFLSQYGVADIDVVNYLWYVTKIRVTPVILLSALGSTRIRKAAVTVFLLWTGFSSGLLITSAVMKMGIKGILLCLIALVPHFAFYIAGYLLLLWYLYFYPEIRWDTSKTAAFFLFLGLGILLECYVNPVIMQMFIRTL
ncbi:MAG: stage II sporulation protein M [Lachnospiraceae bacterium]